MLSQPPWNSSENSHLYISITTNACWRKFSNTTSSSMGVGENSWVALRAAAAGSEQTIKQNIQEWGGRGDLQPSVQGSVISVKNVSFLSEVFPTGSILLISDTTPWERLKGIQIGDLYTVLDHIFQYLHHTVAVSSYNVVKPRHQR